MVIQTCILVLTTSTGVLPYTEAAPATAPNKPTIGLGTCLVESPPCNRYSVMSVSLIGRVVKYNIYIHNHYSFYHVLSL